MGNRSSSPSSSAGSQFVPRPAIAIGFVSNINDPSTGLICAASFSAELRSITDPFARVRCELIRPPRPPRLLFAARFASVRLRLSSFDFGSAVGHNKTLWPFCLHKKQSHSNILATCLQLVISWPLLKQTAHRPCISSESSSCSALAAGFDRGCGIVAATAWLPCGIVPLAGVVVAKSAP